MRRFFKLMTLTMQSRMYYRASFLLNLTTPIILLAGQFLLWNALYGMRGGEAMGGYTREDMYSYILVAFAISNLLTWSSENALSREIRSGTVTARRIRPVSFLSQSLADMCGNLLLQAVANFSVVAVAFALFHGSLSLPEAGVLPLFLLSLLGAVLVRMLLVNFFSLLCFFTTGHLGLSWTRQALMEFFSGALIPIALFPQWLQTVSYLSPFPLMLQTPLSILLGKPLPLSVGVTFALQAAWSLVFLGLHALLYGHIRKTATLAGG